MVEKFTFFWNGPFSNWAKTPFRYKGVDFCTAEQAMMWEKAMTFADDITAAKILATNDAARQKQLGREVKGYVDETWSAIRYDVVKSILFHKFTQHKPSRLALLETAGTTLVEASPYDKIWGIGLAADNPAAQNRATWQGLNLLGQALTEVRNQLLHERA